MSHHPVRGAGVNEDNEMMPFFGSPVVLLCQIYVFDL
jgi:hypothetical protein